MVSSRGSDGADQGIRLSARATSRLLVAKGLEPDQAGNLIAFKHGLRPVEGGWAVDEIQRLLIVRYLVKRHQIGS